MAVGVLFRPAILILYPLFVRFFTIARYHSIQSLETTNNANDHIFRSSIFALWHIKFESVSNGNYKNAIRHDVIIRMSVNCRLFFVRGALNQMEKMEFFSLIAYNKSVGCYYGLQDDFKIYYIH